MFNMDAKMRMFYPGKIAIPKSVRDVLRDARKSNEGRLESGLEKAGKPNVKRHVRQGGYAMKTVVQQPNNAYDIDNGAVFTYEALQLKEGGEMSALAARKMVCDAVQDNKFKKAPEVRNHCVRIYYNDGYWVDVPVYRERTDPNTKDTFLELASADWKKSDPEGVTNWFQDLEQRVSPDVSQGGDPQFRRIVAYVKGIAASRTSWNWPSGFMISVLAEACYSPDSRDDVSLRNTLVQMHDKIGTPIMHPRIADERLDDRGDPDPRCVEMRDTIASFIETLKILDNDNCSEADAAKAWDTVFGTSYFRDGSNGGVKSAFSSSPNPSRFERGEGGRYG